MQGLRLGLLDDNFRRSNAGLRARLAHSAGYERDGGVLREQSTTSHFTNSFGYVKRSNRSVGAVVSRFVRRLHISVEVKTSYQVMLSVLRRIGIRG